MDQNGPLTGRQAEAGTCSAKQNPAAGLTVAGLWWLGMRRDTSLPRPLRPNAVIVTRPCWRVNFDPLLSKKHFAIRAGLTTTKPPHLPLVTQPHPFGRGFLLCGSGGTDARPHVRIEDPRRIKAPSERARCSANG
jgi:hypothetical protein